MMQNFIMEISGLEHEDNGGEIFLRNISRRTTQHYIPEDGNFHLVCRKSYNSLGCLLLLLLLLLSSSSSSSCAVSVIDLVAVDSAHK
jgi:hypothetical protein